MPRKKKSESEKTELDKKCDAVYADGFNIYMMLNKLKKDLKRKDNFPDELVLRFCDHYWKYKPRNSYVYFLMAFKQVSAQWHGEQHEKESNARHKEARSKSVIPAMKDILKGMFGCIMITVLLCGCDDEPIVVTPDMVGAWTNEDYQLIREKIREVDSWEVYQNDKDEIIMIKANDGSFEIWFKQKKGVFPHE